MNVLEGRKRRIILTQTRQMKMSFNFGAQKEIKFFVITLYTIDIIASYTKKEIFLWFVTLALVTDLV